jgi:hypothetical protein
MQVQWRKSGSKIARKGCPFKILNSWFQKKGIILILTALVTLQCCLSSRTRKKKRNQHHVFPANIKVLSNLTSNKKTGLWHFTLCLPLQLFLHTRGTVFAQRPNCLWAIPLF